MASLGRPGCVVSIPRGLRPGLSVAFAVLALLLVPVRVAAQDPLAITAPPALPATALVGQTLTPTAGTWTPPEGTVPSYQWRRCDATGAVCEPLGGATAQPAAYAVTAADAGQTLSVVLTVTAGAEPPVSLASNAASVLRAPSSSAPPTVEGIALDGTLLLASPGGWIGAAPIAIAYQWLRCAPSGASCVALPGATNAGYLLSGSDVGLTLRVRVTASNVAGTATALSAPTGVVAPVPLVNLEPPGITGTAEVERSLMAQPGTWTPTVGVEFVFRWLRCQADRSDCDVIPGANERKYEVRLADVGSRLRVRVTAIADAGSMTLESAQTAVVPAPPRVEEFTQKGTPSTETPAGPEFIQPFPLVRTKGFSTPRGALFKLFTITGSRGADIQLVCNGRTCPYHRRALVSRATVRLRSLERFHRAGTRIVIRITSPGLIGKHTRILIRRGKKPARRDRCLLPGETKPVPCPEPSG